MRRIALHFLGAFAVSLVLLLVVELAGLAEAHAESSAPTACLAGETTALDQTLVERCRTLVLSTRQLNRLGSTGPAALPRGCCPSALFQR